MCGKYREEDVWLQWFWMTWKKSPIKISNEERLKIVSFDNSHNDHTQSGKISIQTAALTEEMNHSENVLKMISKSLFDDDNDHIEEKNLDFVSYHELSDDEWSVQGRDVDDAVTLHYPEVDPPPYLPKVEEDINIDQLIISMTQTHVTSPKLSDYQDYLSAIEELHPGEPPQFPISKMRNDVFSAYLKKKVIHWFNL
jgi:hypothetical protein